MCINEILVMYHNKLRSQRQKLRLGSEAQVSNLRKQPGEKSLRVRESLRTSSQNIMTAILTKWPSYCNAVSGTAAAMHLQQAVPEYVNFPKRPHSTRQSAQAHQWGTLHLKLVPRWEAGQQAPAATRQMEGWNARPEKCKSKKIIWYPGHRQHEQP